MFTSRETSSTILKVKFDLESCPGFEVRAIRRIGTVNGRVELATKR